MTETPSESRPDTWQVPECPLLIEYAPHLLDEIRLAVVDAFFSLPRGGAEIGGILYGTRRSGEVRILAFRAMECEHAHGPSFVLSDKDRDHLRRQLDETNLDVALRGLEVIGWYHSHTRSEIFLSELDLEIYQEFFPQPWQVALVLRPAGMKPTRAGFFLRDRKGTIHSSASYQEFVLANSQANGDAKPHTPANHSPAPPATEPEAKPAPKPLLVTEPEIEPAAAADLAAQPGAAQTVERDQVPEGLPRAPVLWSEDLPVRRPADIAMPVDLRPTEFVPPAFMYPPVPARSRKWMWPVLVLLAAGLGAGAYFTSGSWLRLFAAKPVYLHLEALDTDGQLRIQWDRASLFAQEIQGGTLEIVDGVSKHSVPLDPAKIRMGSFQYARQTEMVEVHLAVRTKHGPIEEFTSFIGQAPARPAKAVDPEQERQSAEQQAETERARADLKKQERRTLELERSLEQMRQQLRRVEERKRVENQIPAADRAAPPAAQTATNQNPAVNRSSPPPAPVAPASPSGNQTAAVNPAPTALNSLSGRWVYSRASKSGSPFPPESIILVMTETDGRVRGVFSGRYRVPKKNSKFNPKVTLNFEGAISTYSKFTFTSPEGLKGNIEIVRLPGKQDAIEVVWTSERDGLTFDDIFFRMP